MDVNYRTIKLKPLDNVAVALEEIPKGAAVQVTCEEQFQSIVMQASIEFGHKFAVVPIPNGTDIIKYGEVIGIAISDIQAGEHVHVHNLDGKRGRGDKIGA